MSLLVVGGIVGLVVVGDAGLDASLVVLRLIILTGTKNFVPFILADTAMEIENLSTEKDSPDTEPIGTQILVDWIGLYAEISAPTFSWCFW